MSLSPVFIVGSPRSGTSILTSGLLRAGYNGFYEGNFLSLIRVVDRLVDRHFSVFGSPNTKVLTSKIDHVALKRELAAVMTDTVRRLNPEEPWLDKTGGPEMIEAIPTLRENFPQSRYVFAKRRAIENLVSRLVKFPSLSFEYHCEDWARTMRAWRILKGNTPRSDCIEIDQRDISTDPAGVAARLGTFLDLKSEATSFVERVFTSQRPQETKAGSSGRVFSLASVGWTPEQVMIFDRVCGEEMRIEGYSSDDGYWLKPQFAHKD